MPLERVLASRSAWGAAADCSRPMWEEIASRARCDLQLAERWQQLLYALELAFAGDEDTAWLDTLAFFWDSLPDSDKLSTAERRRLAREVKANVRADLARHFRKELSHKAAIQERQALRAEAHLRQLTEQRQRELEAMSATARLQSLAPLSALPEQDEHEPQPPPAPPGAHAVVIPAGFSGSSRGGRGEILPYRQAAGGRSGAAAPGWPGGGDAELRRPLLSDPGSPVAAPPPPPQQQQQGQHGAPPAQHSAACSTAGRDSTNILLERFLGTEGAAGHAAAAQAAGGGPSPSLPESELRAAASSSGSAATSASGAEQQLLHAPCGGGPCQGAAWALGGASGAAAAQPKRAAAAAAADAAAAGPAGLV